MPAIGDEVIYVGGRGTGLPARAYPAIIVSTPDDDPSLPPDSAAVELTARGKVQSVRAYRAVGDVPTVGRWHVVTP